MSILTTKINIAGLRAMIDAADHLQEAGEDAKAKEIIIMMANKIKAEK